MASAEEEISVVHEPFEGADGVHLQVHCPVGQPQLVPQLQEHPGPSGHQHPPSHERWPRSIPMMKVWKF